MPTSDPRSNDPRGTNPGGGPPSGDGDPPPSPISPSTGEWATIAQQGQPLAEQRTEPPPSLDAYEFVKPLGAGGQGQVWLARDLHRDGWAAIKYLSPTGDRITDLNRANNLSREAGTLAEVQHPNLVRMIEYTDIPYPHIVLEYCFGGPLSDRVRHTALPTTVAAAVVETLGRAVHALNTAGFVHRDLKPANVLLRADGEPVVADLGLVRSTADARPNPSPPAGRQTGDRDAILTRTGQFMGTPGFAPPEFAAHANKAGATADVYGLGAVLYQSLTGHPPFSGRNLDELIYWTQTRPVIPVRERNPAVPPPLEAVCLRCLEKDPANRYASAAALSNDLERFRLGRPVEATGEGFARRLGRAAGRVFRLRPDPVADPQTLFRTTFGMRPPEMSARLAELTRLTELRRSEAGLSFERPQQPDERTGTSGAAVVLESQADAGAVHSPVGGVGRHGGTESELTIGVPWPVGGVGSGDPPPVPPTARGGSHDGNRDPRPSCLGALDPRLWLRSRPDPVDCSVFAPPTVPIGGAFLVQVFAHLPDRRAEAERIARAGDDRAGFRVLTSLGVDIHRGTELGIHLVFPGFEVDEPWQQMIWQGRTTPVHFLVTAPTGLTAGEKFGTVIISLGRVPYGHLKFKITAISIPTAEARTTWQEAVGFNACRYRHVFVSYASPDRDEVVKRVQMLKLLKLQVFQDVMDLEPGARWERELYRHIDRSDLFLLFWSSAARGSKWVRKELQYAIDRKAGLDHAPPEILPVVIEGPPPPDPPTGFQDRHFTDPVLYFISPRGR